MLKGLKLALILALFQFLFCNCQSDDSQPSSTLDSIDGFNTSLLKKAIDNASNLPNFYALLVVKDNNIVVEKYFNGKNQNSLFHLRSITKNFTSAVANVALKQGLFNDIDSSIKTFYPNLVEGGKEEITIRHLLNMSSGLQWNEEEEIVDFLTGNKTNSITDMLTRELTSAPGNVFNYNTILPHILSDIISKQSNRPYIDYVKQELLDPLGITDFDWERASEGAVWGGGGLQIKARDLVKFGKLYLNDGIWKDAQLISKEWVISSKTTQIQTDSPTTGYSNYWWIAQNLNTPLYFGNGFGGQTLMLLPEKNIMIIAFQEHFVGFEQNDLQWNNFLSDVFQPLFNSIE